MIIDHVLIMILLFAAAVYISDYTAGQKYIIFKNRCPLSNYRLTFRNKILNKIFFLNQSFSIKFTSHVQINVVTIESTYSNDHSYQHPTATTLQRIS